MADQTPTWHGPLFSFGGGCVLAGIGALITYAVAPTPHPWVCRGGIALIIVGFLIMASSLVPQFSYKLLRTRASEETPQLSPIDFVVMGPQLAEDFGRPLRVIQQARAEIVAAYKRFVPECERESSSNRPNKLARIQKLMRQLADEMTPRIDRMDSVVPQVEDAATKAAQSFRSMGRYARRRAYDRAGLRLLRSQIAGFLKFMKTERRPSADFQRFIKNLRGNTTIEVDAAGIRITQINARLKSAFDGIRASCRRTLWVLYGLIYFGWLYRSLLRVLRLG